MNARSAFTHIMATQPSMALATQAEGGPNVRVVNFCWQPESRRVYFATFPDNDKVAEIDACPRVTFTTIPSVGNAHVRAHGLCRRSSFTVRDVAADIVAKVPDYQGTVDAFGDVLVLFEIEFAKAEVTLELGQTEWIEL